MVSTEEETPKIFPLTVVEVNLCKLLSTLLRTEAICALVNGSLGLKLPSELPPIIPLSFMTAT